MLSIKVPVLGESIVEATISRWLKQEGDRVNAGDTLVELETDKVTVEVPALKAGVLVRRAKAEGDVVAVNDVLGDIDDAAAGAASASEPAPAPLAVAPAVAPAPAPAAAAPVAAAAPAVVAPIATSAAEKSSPAARRLAAEEGVDLSQVAGTGRGGVVSKPDVVEHWPQRRRRRCRPSRLRPRLQSRRRSQCLPRRLPHRRPPQRRRRPRRRHRPAPPSVARANRARR